MKIVLDTNRYSDLARGIPEVLERLKLAEEVFLPFIVLAELRAGFLAGTRREENERALERFLASPGVSVLFPSIETVNQYAALHLQLRLQGTPIPPSDLWIASLALQHGLTLYARDRHFDHIPQLQRI